MSQIEDVQSGTESPSPQITLDALPALYLWLAGLLAVNA